MMSLSTSLFLVMTSLMCHMTLGQQRRLVRPVAFTLPRPPTLTGSLRMNKALTIAERVHLGQFLGPASIIVDGDKVYVGTKDGKIYNMASCIPKLVVNMMPPLCRGRPKCSQLVSMRKDPTTGGLLVLDTFRGLFRVDPLTGFIQAIFNVNSPVGGRRSKHLNDLVVTSGGLALISDSSDTWDFNNDISIAIEGRKAGRVILVDTNNGRSAVLPVQFVFPNGLELSPDEKILLVTETAMARVLWVKLDGSYQKGIFANNLPGLPDQIRSSDHGTFWVGMHYPRHNYVENPLDKFGPMEPHMKQMGIGMRTDTMIRNMFGKYGIAVELNMQGRISRTVQDPKGAVYRSVTEVVDRGGVLYVGSDKTRFVGRIQDKSRVLTPEAQAQVDQTSCLNLGNTQSNHLALPPKGGLGLGDLTLGGQLTGFGASQSFSQLPVGFSG